MNSATRMFMAICLPFVGLGGPLTSPATVEPIDISTVDTCVYPAHFVDEGEYEVEIPGLEALPLSIRTRLHDHLEARLGKEFAARLRFKEGGFVDPADIPAVVQRYRELDREYEAYVVLFSLKLEEGREYCAGVHLKVDGGIVMDIGLPRIAANPSKARIVPASTAMAVAAEHGLSQHTPSVELEYDPHLDVLVWTISQVSAKPGRRPQITTCNVDAHTGKFIGWTTRDIWLASHSRPFTGEISVHPAVLLQVLPEAGPEAANPP